MISLTQTRYGSATSPGRARQGSDRRWRAYHARSREAGAVTTDDTDSGMAREARYVYGARPLGALVPRVTRLAFRRRAPATAQVLADWPAIVGPAIARVTTPPRPPAGHLPTARAGP